MSGLTAVTVGAGVSAPEGAASTRASEPRIRNRTVERRVARRAPRKRRPCDRRWSTPRSPVFPNPMPRNNFSLEPPPRTFRYAGSPLPRRAAEGNRNRIGASGRERKIAEDCQEAHRFHMCPVGRRDLAARRDTRVGRFPNWRDVDPSFAGSPRESRPRKGLGGVPVEGAGRADLVMFRADLSGWHQRGSPVCPPPAPGHVALRDFLPPGAPGCGTVPPFSVRADSGSPSPGRPSRYVRTNGAPVARGPGPSSNG